MNYIDNAWNNFQSTGKIEDYLSYKKIHEINSINLQPEANIQYANKKKGHRNEPTEYR